MAESTSASSADRDPILDYTNWAEWSEYWHGHLSIFDFWRYTDPSSANVLPPSTNSINREIIKQAAGLLLKIRQHVSPECRALLKGQITLRDTWIALKASCDRGNTLPLISLAEAFNFNKWEDKDIIVSYVFRLRNLYLKLEPTPFQIQRDMAVHTLIDRLPDCYKSEGLAAKQLNLSFIETSANLLANIKDSTTTGDNLAGHALYHQGRGRGRRQNRRFPQQNSDHDSSRD
jgi:hypothetical protein